MSDYYKVERLNLNSPIGELILSVKDKNIFLDRITSEIVEDCNIHLLSNQIPKVNLELECDEIKIIFKEHNK